MIAPSNPIQTYFNNSAEIFYQKYSGTHILGKEIVDKYLNLLFPFSQNKNVLEVGCGSATFTTHISKISSKTFGIDFSEKMLHIAKKVDPKTFFSIGNAVLLPFKKNSFDMVYSFRTLQHVPNFKQSLSEMVKIVKPRGLVIFDFINKRNFLGYIRSQWFHPPRHVYLKAFSSSEICKTCEELQLEILHIKPLQFLLDSSNLNKYLPPPFSSLAIRLFNMLDFTPHETSWLSKFSMRSVIIAKKGDSSL